MRSTSYSRGATNKKNIPWQWISIIGGIIVLLFIVRIFWSPSTVSSENYLTVTPGEQSSVYISMTSSSKNRITWEEKLYATDKSVSVELWNATAKNSDMMIDIDKWSELWYTSSTTSGNIISLSKWRAWIQDITKPLQIELKNYTVLAPMWSIFIVEQNGPYSYTYALAGSVDIDTPIGKKTINAGSMVSLLKSDFTNPDTNLDEWIRPIEGSILEYPLFTRNDGMSLLSQSGINTLSGSTDTTDISNSTGSILTQWGQRFLEVTDPKPGILSKSTTITVMGNLLSKEVKRVTINNVDAIVSPVNETFVLQDIDITGEIFDIVYKAYDSNNSLLESSVLSIFGPKWVATQNSSPLIPETFPVSAKDFKITYPVGNPYSTTEWFIKVQGVLPKNTVDYIVVNDYRLQKYIPKSGTWYYFANMDTGTMKEWLNLYTIKFYRADGTLLYTQPFTIIKESKNATVSGE